MDRGHLYPAENANGVCLPLLLSTRFHRNGIQHFSLEQPLYKKVHTLLGDLNQHIIIIINIIVITILQKVRVSFMFRDHYRPNPFLPQLRASYFHPRILFSSFACLWPFFVLQFSNWSYVSIWNAKIKRSQPISSVRCFLIVCFSDKKLPHLFAFVFLQKKIKPEKIMFNFLKIVFNFTGSLFPLLCS